MSNAFLRMACGIGLLLQVSACGPEPDYVDAVDWDSRRGGRSLFYRGGNNGAEEDEAIELVKQHEAPEGEGTVEEWIDRQIGEKRGDVMFPRWEARRSAPNRYEVRYTYTYRDVDLRIEKRGYQWDVDTMIDVVGDMTHLSPEEVDGRARRAREQLERLDQIRDEYTLE